MPVVAILTDFGNSEYVGVMKGVILAHAPQATLVDLTHQVGPQDVRAGAWVLLQTFAHFPSGTTFLCVVDPGVGSTRQAVAAETDRYRFVGPDNGLMWPAIAADGGPRAAVTLPLPAGASQTFHGRDLFAPAAGRLAAGEPLASLGAPAAPLQALTFYREGRCGEVVRVDSFGNIITTLPPVPGQTAYRAELPDWSGTLHLYPHYAAAPDGEPVLIVGSSGTIEIAVKNGSAAARLPGLRPGERLCLH